MKTETLFLIHDVCTIEKKYLSSHFVSCAEQRKHYYTDNGRNITKTRAYFGENEFFMKAVRPSVRPSVRLLISKVRLIKIRYTVYPSFL